MDVAGQIITQKTPRALWDNNIHAPQDGRKILWEFFIFMEFGHYPTILLSTRQWILLARNEIAVYEAILHHKNTKGYIGQLYTYSTI